MDLGPLADPATPRRLNDALRRVPPAILAPPQQPGNHSVGVARGRAADEAPAPTQAGRDRPPEGSDQE